MDNHISISKTLQRGARWLALLLLLILVAHPLVHAEEALHSHGAVGGHSLECPLCAPVALTAGPSLVTNIRCVEVLYESSVALIIEPSAPLPSRGRSPPSGRTAQV